MNKVYVVIYNYNDFSSEKVGLSTDVCSSLEKARELLKIEKELALGHWADYNSELVEENDNEFVMVWSGQCSGCFRAKIQETEIKP